MLGIAFQQIFERRGSIIEAAERFDSERGVKFITYGAWWIKQSIKRALANQSKTIRLPVHLVDKISKMRRTAMKLTEELGREPTDEELAIELQIPTSKVAHLKSVSVRPASLDAPIGEDGDSATFGEIVGDDNAVTPYEGLREKNLNSDLSAMVDSLDKREAEIIKLRFGLEGRDELTLEEVQSLVLIGDDQDVAWHVLAHLRGSEHFASDFHFLLFDLFARSSRESAIDSPCRTAASSPACFAR